LPLLLWELYLPKVQQQQQQQRQELQLVEQLEVQQVGKHLAYHLKTFLESMILLLALLSDLFIY
jgi:hypothetical protein